MPNHFLTVERWATAAVFAAGMVLFIAPALNAPYALAKAPNRFLFEQANVPFRFYQHYLVPSLIRFGFLFLSFFLLNFRLIPRLLEGRQQLKNKLLALGVLVLFLVVNVLTERYLSAYLFNGALQHEDVYRILLRQSFLFTGGALFIFAGYTFIKYSGLYFFPRMIKFLKTRTFITREVLVTFAIWVFVGILLGVNDMPEILLLWTIVVPSSLACYLFATRKLIPWAARKRRPLLYFLLCTIGLLVLLFFGTTLLLVGITDNGDVAASMSLVNAFIQFLVVAPASWIIYKRSMRGKEELVALQKELGASTANLDFLRSQINPHFLFNALNTIYGTAIQEGAERTSTIIEKLGDMMRFMLQENMQEKISLSRDIEYLNNYIGMQTLRTQSSPGISIQIDLPEVVDPALQIAPMLLIPFIENAFKHGISLREQSHIRVSLEVKESMLYFDVYNTKHPKPLNDPEKRHNGIGLVNVRQRLQLLYPGKHDLVIRETAKDFFVHLTVNLEK